VLVHIDTENDEGLFENGRPLARSDVQRLLERYFADVKFIIEEFRIHYLDGQIEVEVIFPLALGEQPHSLLKLKQQSRRMVAQERKINGVHLFFKA